MGCCSSKNLPPDRLGSEHGSVDESLLLMKECGEKWRMEPQKALNHFLKGTSEEDSYFGKDGSMFDYFQDDEFVELRLLLDEPLGRSHFLAHVERFSPSNTDLVRLWLFLHQYHTINAEDSFERYQAAKNLYKNYFHISPNAKQEAEEYRLSNCVPDIAEDDDDHEASINEKAEAAAFLEYHKMLVPSRCRDLPPFIIATIIKMRPAVEQALVEAQERLELTSPLNATAPGMALGGPEMRTRRFSSSLSNFVDWNGEKPRDLPEIPKIGGSEQEFVDAKQGDQGEEAAKAEVVEEDGVTLAQANDDEKETTTKKEDDDRQFPPVHLFIDLQNEVFIEMKPLYHHFKITSEDYEAYRKSKKIVYNHVEPKDFKYIQVLGKGGFGQVVHVVKRSTGKHYAMKVQAKDTLIDTWGGKMQHVEIERDVLVAHRSFPFIVSLRYAFQDDKYAFLCLDLAENGSLRALLEMSPGFQLGAPQVRLYVAEIVLALECLHDHEIIYRDLKPENVLLCADGHIMLADMGLAGFYYQDKYTREEEGIETNALDEMDDEDTELFAEFEEDLKSEHAQISDADGTGTDAGDTCSESGGTSSGEGDGHPDEPKVVKRAKTIKSHDTDCGTPLYRPPEMIRHEHYNEGVDWFMLGVFTYECLFGQLPFQPRADKISDSGMIELETDEDELKLLRKKVNVPASDPPTRELLLGLLDLNPKTRLGVGPAEMKRDLDSLKEHPYFIPITGPLATKCDWEKVLHKAYKPVYVPEERKLEEKSQFSSFDALVKSWKKNAKREAREYAKRKKKKADYNIQILKEGKPIDKSLEHYFDNWDYIDPESINLEKEAEKRAQVEESGVERTFSRASHIRSDLSKSFKRVRDGFKRQRTRSIDD